MPTLVSLQAGRALRRALALTVLAAASPALAQPPAPETGRSIATTGRTMPHPGAARPSAAQPGPAASKATTDAAVVKAQRAAEDRSKAWDSKMHKTMGTICNGC